MTQYNNLRNILSNWDFCITYLTEDLTSFPNSKKLWWYFWKYNFYKVCISFYLIWFSLFYTLFCSLSQNKLSRQDVPFIVIMVTYSSYLISKQHRRLGLGSRHLTRHIDRGRRQLIRLTIDVDEMHQPRKILQIGRHGDVPLRFHGQILLVMAQVVLQHAL